MNAQHFHNFKKLTLLLLFSIASNIAHSQEFMHWKFLEGNKTDRIKTETVWQYPTSDTSSIEKKLFSYQKFDCLGRISESRMYSTDTSFYSYDGDDEWRTFISDGKKMTLKKTINRSKTGKVTYEKGEFGQEYHYYYDSLDRETKMIVFPGDDEFESPDTLVNLLFYSSANTDSLRQHFSGGVLKFETRSFFDSNKNCVKRIYCSYNFDEATVCDTTIYSYNKSGQKIHQIQQWHSPNDSATRIEERHWDYDKKGRMIMASDNVSICKWSYNKKGYVTEAKRFNKENELRFFVKYEQTFWTKKEIRTAKKNNKRDNLPFPLNNRIKPYF